MECTCVLRLLGGTQDERWHAVRRTNEARVAADRDHTVCVRQRRVSHAHDRRDLEARTSTV